MNLTEFLSAKGGPIAFNVEGLDGPLYCRLLSMDELSKLVRGKDAAGDGFGIMMSMLATCVVDANGLPVSTEEAWRKTPAANRKTLEAISREVQRINGMASNEDLSAAGKP